MTKNIAFPTDDGQTISSHFGQAHFFQVIKVEGQKVLSSELREKASHSHQDHSHAGGSQPHPGQAMFEVIRDCQVLIAGGMGTPALERAKSFNMEVFLTGEKLISDALRAYQDGNLVTDLRRVHVH